MDLDGYNLSLFESSQYGPNPRLDSWDLENIRYIRKKSESHHHRLFLEEYSLPEEGRMRHSPEYEYPSSSSSSSSFSPWQDQELATLLNRNHQTQFHPSPDKDVNADVVLPHTPDDYEEEEDVPPEIDPQPSSLVEYPNRNRLDDCYLLDVLTIGNDVLKDQHEGPPDQEEEEEEHVSLPAKVQPSVSSSRRINQRQRQPMLQVMAGGRGSLGTSSISSPPSSSPSVSSGDDEESQYHKDVASSYCSRPDERDCQSDISSSSPESCLLCSDECSNRGSDHFFMNSPQSRKDRFINKHPNTSSPSRMGDDWRSSSPYYVRLRRDLYSMTPPLPTTPTRFGVDKQGQLVIDYSHNWSGLELYIKQLHLA